MAYVPVKVVLIVEESVLTPLCEPADWPNALTARSPLSQALRSNIALESSGLATAVNNQRLEASKWDIVDLGPSRIDARADERYRDRHKEERQEKTGTEL